MKKITFLLTILALALVSGLLFSSCVVEPNQEGETKRDAITLSADTWTDGAISSISKEQWFKFTATSGTQYLHVFFGTMTTVYVQLYDSNNNALGSGTTLSTSVPYRSYTSLTVTSGREYYVKVTQNTSFSSSYGTYRIGFNATPTAPGILAGAVPLTVGTWADGVITSTGGEQWFKFTATTSMHYIHIFFGTLTALSVQLHDSAGGTLGSSTTLASFAGYRRYTSLLVTSGQTYYVRVAPASGIGSNSGTYRIAVNTSETAPEN